MTNEHMHDELEGSCDIGTKMFKGVNADNLRFTSFAVAQWQILSERLRFLFRRYDLLLDL